MFLYGFLLLPSVASTTMATSLFASLMPDGGIIVERSLFELGSFLTGLKCDIASFLSSASPPVKSFFTLEIMHYVL